MLSRLAIATLLCVASLGMPRSSSAQIVDRFGVSLGAVSASVSNSYDPPGDRPEKDFERRQGVSAHLFAEEQVLPYLAVHVGIGYVQRGFTETIREYYYRSVVPADYAARAPDAKTRLDYLSMPVLAKLYYYHAETRLYVLAGPRVDLLLSYKQVVFEDSGPIPIKSHYALSYDTWAAGGTIGAGMSVDVGLPGRLLLEGRLDVDLTDSYGVDPREMRNHAATLMIGMAF